jgi:colicin import membrane protein
MKKFLSAAMLFLLIASAGLFAQSRADQRGNADYGNDRPTTRQEQQRRDEEVRRQQQAERERQEAERQRQQAAAEQRAQEKAAADARAAEAARQKAAQEERDRSYIIRSGDSEMLVTPPKDY